MIQYTVHNKTFLESLNTEISNLILAEQPSSIIRVGNTEGYFLETIFNNEKFSEELFNWLAYPAGVYPIDNIDYLKNIWATINFKAINNSNILGFVDISNSIQNNKNFLQTFANNKTTFFKEDIIVLDPGYLSNLGITDVICKNPWTKNLNNKKVLIISSHIASITEQWKNITNIWGTLRSNIVPFNLVGIVRAPFHPLLDSRQYLNCKNWNDTLLAMCKEMDKIDYDVALIAAGAYAPALANHAKLSDKIGITVGGTLQLYFGILGSRWTKASVYAPWNKLFNEHWKYPLEEDLPQNKHIFNQFEQAYW